ncbi:hypothetical protein AB0J28_40475 [Streptosporangium canum]|uniref:hypothetical protein n=1 Tax=Streptosporangium canum TaxID=324952 RepID=UPI00343342E0
MKVAVSTFPADAGDLCGDKRLRQAVRVKFMEWNFQAAEDLAAALRAGEVSSVELTDEAIARIERDDKVINTICVPDFARARAAARGADQARAW